MCGPPLPALSDPFRSLTAPARAVGSRGFKAAPGGGDNAASGSYSEPLFALNAKAEATSCVAVALSAAASPIPEVFGSAGPLTVVRLFRIVLLLLESFVACECFCVFEGLEDFAMGIREELNCAMNCRSILCASEVCCRICPQAESATMSCAFDREYETTHDM
jgi:hypothetical protein